MHLGRNIERMHGCCGPRTLVLALAVVLAVVLGMAWPSPAHADPVSAVVFDFELLDTSLQGEVEGANPEETKRLAMIGDQLRQLLAESGKYSIVDHGPAAAQIADAGYLHACNGCEADIAKSLGAEQAISGLVQKVSNLILNINIYVRDARTGDLVAAASADIRGNTDKSWSRGVGWLVRNRLLKD